MRVDLVGAVALVLGTFYGMRWTSLRSAEPVPARDQAVALWQRVQRAERRALLLMVSACFANVFLDLALQWVAPRTGTPTRIQSAMSLAIDVGWMALMFVGLRMRASARRRRAELGMPPQDPGA
jgi:hypothetical protein